MLNYKMNKIVINKLCELKIIKLNPGDDNMR